ncbi:hypothetical protein TNCV_2474871 [Trichonephila clavipes]|nr:hypothetical protein TNCV_2474871 [Trichonephila clavipes]
MVFTKQEKHPFCVGLLVDDACSDLVLPSSIFQRIGFIGQRHGHRSGRNVLGKASIGYMTNEKCSKHLSLLYVSKRKRVKNETHGNPTMIAKGMQEPFERLECCVRHTNSTNIEVD